jgi:serine/threonine protein phosphatase PrpC
MIFVLLWRDFDHSKHVVGKLGFLVIIHDSASRPTAPEVTSRRITPDCAFLVLTSDDLRSKVSNQEAVDVVAWRIGIHSSKVLLKLLLKRWANVL